MASKLMTLSERLNSTKTAQTGVMYSAVGAHFQEWALSILDSRGSEAHKAIGRFVTAINNGHLSVGAAEDAYIALLRK